MFCNKIIVSDLMLGGKLTHFVLSALRAVIDVLSSYTSHAILLEPTCSRRGFWLKE